MYESKLVRVLRKFTKEEFSEFKKYLHTVITKDGLILKNSLSLFKAIHNHYPYTDQKKIKKESIYKKIYPGQAYKSGKLEKQMSSLFTLVQEFIVVNNTGKKNELHQLLTLYTFYRSRGLNSLASIHIKKYQKIIEERDRGESAYFYDSFLLEKEISNHQAIFLDAKKNLNFPQALKNLDQYYIFEKLELACRLLVINRFVFPVDLKDSLTVLQYLKPLMESGYFDIPMIKVYYKAYCFLSAEETEIEAAFLVFEETLKIHYASIPEAQLLPLNSIIRNYCVLQFHRGVEGYLEKGFLVYKDHLEKGYLYRDGQLFASTLTFKSITR